MLLQLLQIIGKLFGIRLARPWWIPPAFRITLCCYSAAFVLAGCSGKAPNPAAVPTDAASQLGQILERLYVHRGTYGQALVGLEQYFLDRGFGLRAKWARHEREDLRQVPKYLYDRGTTNLPKVDVGAGAKPFQIAGLDETEIVERFARERYYYHRTLEELVSFFSRSNDARLTQANLELEYARQVRPYSYLDRVYIPPALTPTESIAAADSLYASGMDDLNKLRFIPAVGFWVRESAEQTARRGLSKLRRLIEQFPTSDKIDEAAYYMGYFSFEYLKDEEIAASFFERAFEYNPDIQKPARFRAAICYDYRLHDRDRALQLYNESLTKDPPSGSLPGSRARWAASRIRALTEGETGQGEPPPPIE